MTMLILSKSANTIEDLMAKTSEGNVKILNVLLKTDVGGSLEAIKQSIAKMIPSKAPINREILTDELLYKLSDLTEGFSHRELKNVALMVLTECCKKDSQITEELLVDVFTRKKEEFEERKNKEGKRKEELGNKITEKLKSGDYNVSKSAASESTDNSESQANSNEEKTEDKKEK